MFIGYESLLSGVKKYSSEKLNYVLIANDFKGMFKYIISLFLVYFLVALIVRNFIVTIIIYVIYAMVAGFIMGNRKIGLGVNDNMIFLEYYKVIGLIPKNIYDVPYDKIKYISLHKFFNFCYLKLSFISSERKFEQLKIVFSSNTVGSFRKQQKENFQGVYKKLIEVEKIVDKGDF